MFKIGFLNLLTIVFIVLKLTHYIDWGWLWILLPTILQICIVLVILIAIIVMAVLNMERS